MTFTRAVATNNYGPAKFIVDGTTVANGTHSTIQAAITSASSGDVIFIRPGTYTENLTLKSGVRLQAWGDPFTITTTPVRIVGKATLTTGTVGFTNIHFSTNGDFILDISGGSTVANFYTCFFNATNAVALNAASFAQIRLFDCGGVDQGLSSILAANQSTITIINSTFTGGSGNANTISNGGSLTIRNSTFLPAITTSDANTIFNAYRCTFGSLNNTALTCGGTGVNLAFGCSFEAGTASAISVGTGASLTLADCTINSSNTNAITGLGTLVYGGLVFTSTSSTINTTVQTVRSEGPSRTIGSANSGATNTLTVNNTSNTTSSQALIQTTVGGGTAGDPFHTYTVSGATNWSQGIDNSASDAFVIAASAALGTSNAASWDTSGNLTNTGTITAPDAILTNRTAYAVLTGGTTSAGVLQSVSGVGTAGQVLTSAGAGALPVWSGSAPISVWTDASGSFSAAAGHGYFISAAATPTLPAAPAEGDTISFILDAAALCTITGNTGQKIRVGAALSAAAGTCASSVQGSAITLVYRSTGTTWFSQGAPEATWTVT